MFESLREGGGVGIRELWQRLRPGAFAAGLSGLLQSLRFTDGQGQLWPLRVLTSDDRLTKPLQQAGCVVVVDDLASSSSPSLAVDALCLRLRDRAGLATLPSLAERVRSGGMVVLCTRSGSLPRQLLTASCIHAGLVDIQQQTAGRYLLTCGRVLPRC